MRLAVLAVFAAFLVGGCASRLSTGDSSNTVRTRAPVNHESTITSYFDFNVADDPKLRKLIFSPPEASRCALSIGGSGAHQGFVVPVIYDTSPRPSAAIATPTATTAAATTAAAAKNTKAPAAKNAKKPPAPPTAVSTSGTATTEVSAAPTDALSSPTAQPMTFKEIQITGNRYFFWFTNETISAVTRRLDACP